MRSQDLVARRSEPDLTALREEWLAKERDRCREEIVRSTAAVENLAAQLRSAVRVLHETRQRLAELQQRDMGSPLSSLPVASLPDVSDVKIDGDDLLVLTRPLTIKYAGVTYDIGSFRITLSRDVGVRVLSEDRPAGATGAWIHPHVQADMPCLGNARVGLEKLVGMAEHTAAVDVLLRFLGSYDPDTAYCSITNWPIVAGQTRSP